MITLKLTCTAVIAVMLTGCAHQPPVSGRHAGAPIEITLLHINDHHSHLDQDTLTLTLPDASGVARPVQVPTGGFPRVISALRTLGDQQPNVIRIHSGDAVTGDLYFNLNQGQADADLMGLACFDTFTLGNHEFDSRDQGLAGFLEMLERTPCPPVVLSANVRFGANSPLSPAVRPNAVKPYTILERDGQKIGLIGVTIAGKTKNSSRPDPDTHFLDEQNTVQEHIDELRAQGVNKIIVQSHIGYKRDRKLARNLRGVDVIVGGDSHSLLGPPDLQALGLKAEGPYPTVERSADGHPVCVVQAWQYAQVVGRLAVRFDENGIVQSCQGQPWLLAGTSVTHNGKPLPANERQAILSALEANPVVLLTEPARDAQGLLAPYAQTKQRFGEQVLVRNTSNLCLRRVPGTTLDPARSALGTVCNENPHVIAHGGDVQQLVAQALLDYGKHYFEAEIALQNAGGVRIDLPAGPVTVADTYATLPFKNQLVRIDIYGHELKASLEEGLDALLVNRGSGGFPYAAGLRWNVDLGKPKGERFSALEVDDAQGNPAPLQADQRYRLVTIDFLADGASGYRTLGNLPAERKVNTGLDYTQAFLDYLHTLGKADKPLERLPTRAYSTQSFKESNR